MNIINYCNRTIEYSFYLLFLLVPLFFMGNTSELFEFNKMWLTFGLAIIIGTAWITKIIIERKITIVKTPLDIPIILFLISQIISSIFSLDTHVSFWGYYSRFNGGLLSTISYVFLYYAFVSNLEIKHVIRVLYVSIFSGTITALWGLPSHFGYDPTCLVFRGELNTNCWTDAFKPTVRVFSTLGQPAWFAAYMDVLLLLSMAYMLISAHRKKLISTIMYFVLSILFYMCLYYTTTRAGIYGFLAADFIFWAFLIFKRVIKIPIVIKYFLIIHIAFAIFQFFNGVYFSPFFDKFTLPQLQKSFSVHAQAPGEKTQNKVIPKTEGVTDSSEIRKIVWKGAIDAWKANPIFGTGVETFAFAYYKYRPAEHNLTSEWDYLYNKAHNEYLNYLTTTGIFGLGTYLLYILIFIYLALKFIFTFKGEGYARFLLTLSIFSAFLTILITNFGGFSVVIMNLYLFLIPVFVFLIIGRVSADKNYTIDIGSLPKKHDLTINSFQWTLIVIFFLIAGFYIIGLLRYWYADTQYALGTNLDHSSAYQQALPLLQNAESIEPDEPVFKDELAVNMATLATALYQQNDAATADQLTNMAIKLDDQVINDHPNNVVYWKNRLRIFYGLAQANTQNKQKYIIESLRAIKKSSELAPTDAKISYNMGVLLGQTGYTQDAVSELERTIKLKPDYIDAYNALGLLYESLAFDESPNNSATDSAKKKIVNREWQKKAIDLYQYIYDNVQPGNETIKKTLDSIKNR